MFALHLDSNWLIVVVLRTLVLKYFVVEGTTLKLTVEEKLILSDYRALNTPYKRIKWIALRCWLRTGDFSLVAAIYKQACAARKLLRKPAA